LLNNNLWWRGQVWLKLDSSRWPKVKPGVQVLQVHAGRPEPELIKRYSSLTRLTRVMAWYLRPVRKLRLKGKRGKSLPNLLMTSYLSMSRAYLIRLVRERAFSTEIALVKAGRALPKGSKLEKLNAFVEVDSGILRVGGRLSGSELTLNHRYSPILRHDSSFSRLFRNKSVAFRISQRSND
jgi:hypothetical protein